MTHLRTTRYMQLLHTYRVVSAEPSPKESNTTYLINAQNSITVSGLDGNIDKHYIIDVVVVNPTTNDSVTLRFNGISTNVYDYRYSYAGSTSTTASNATSSIALCPTSGGGSLNHISLEIDAKTGMNRHTLTTASQVGSSQQAVAGLLVSGGVWRDNSTNITSMTFGFSSISGGYGLGSTIKVYRLVS